MRGMDSIKLQGPESEQPCLSLREQWWPADLTEERAMPLTEADLFEYRNVCAGRQGRQWTAIRKLLDEVRRLTRDLRAAKPAGVVRNEEIDAVVRSSLELHRNLTSLMSKLR